MNNPHTIAEAHTHLIFTRCQAEITSFSTYNPSGIHAQSKWNGGFVTELSFTVRIFMIEPTQYLPHNTLQALAYYPNDCRTKRWDGWQTTQLFNSHYTTFPFPNQSKVALDRLSIVCVCMCCKLHRSHNRVHSSGTYERIMYAIKRTRTIPIWSIQHK